MASQFDVKIEERRQAAQSAIDAAKPASVRNRLGQFATPNALALDIAQFVASVSDHRIPIQFADPSVGSGSFFSAALAVFGRERIRSAIGVEVDPAFADVACDLWGKAGLKVVRGDFTRIVGGPDRPPAPNLILANPPYIRHHHLNREEKERLQRLAREMTGVDVNGLAGLYVYFFLLATAWLQEDGYAAWLIPSEFMDVNYGRTLKRFLTDRVTLIRAHRFSPDDVQFADALVSSVVLVFKKSPPPTGHQPQFTFGGTLDVPHASDRLSLNQLRDSRKWTAYPAHANNDRRTLGDEHSPTLADFFRVKRGIATGDNKFFILERADAIQRGFPSDFLRPILPSPRHLRTTVIESEDDGYPAMDRQLCLIDCSLPEHVVEQRYRPLWEYLRSAEAMGIKEGYLVSKRTPWYKQEQREPSLFLCTYMGRGSDDKQPFRFILNYSRAIATNLYLMLYPQGGLAVMLQKYPERAVDAHRMLGQVTGHELRGEGRVYGGGLNKIEPKELGRVSAATFIQRWPELSATVGRLKSPSLF